MTTAYAITAEDSQHHKCHDVLTICDINNRLSVKSWLMMAKAFF